MKIEPISAHAKRSGLNVPSVPAKAVPTKTGATAAGSVRGRAATSHRRSAPPTSGPRPARGPPPGSGPLRELSEIGLALLGVGSASLLRLLRAVEEEVGVVRELLDSGQPVLGRVEARLQQAQREGGEGEHLAAPLDRLLLELLERDDGVDEPHLERLPGVVLAAQEPDLLRLLHPDDVRQQRGAEAAVEAPHARAGLAEARVVGGDREVADHVEHVAAAHCVAGHHRDDRLGSAAHLQVQVGHVEAADPAAGGLLVGHVAAVAADALVPARAERQRPLAGEHDHADVEVLAGAVERFGNLDDRLRPERVAHLWAVDRDLRDALGDLVADVLELARRAPVERGPDLLGGCHGAPTIKPWTTGSPSGLAPIPTARRSWPAAGPSSTASWTRRPRARPAGWRRSGWGRATAWPRPCRRASRSPSCCTRCRSWAPYWFR